MTRRRPIGWRGDSYRHYLAAKGIPTNRYFVRNELKGNRGGSTLHSLWAQGYSNEEIERIFGIAVPKKKRSTVFDVPDRDVLLGQREPQFSEPLQEPPSPVTVEEQSLVSQPVQESLGQSQPQPLSQLIVPETEVTVSTPGVPTQPESFDILEGGRG